MGFPSQRVEGAGKEEQRSRGPVPLGSVMWNSPRAIAGKRGLLNSWQVSTQRQDLGVQEGLQCDGYWHLVSSPCLGC